MSAVPDEELNLLVNTVNLAVARANRGDVAGGHDELLYGLQRAEAARDDREEWGEELVGRWQRAVDRFREQYRIGRA